VIAAFSALRASVSVRGVTDDGPIALSGQKGLSINGETLCCLSHCRKNKGEKQRKPRSGHGYIRRTTRVAHGWRSV